MKTYKSIKSKFTILTKFIYGWDHCCTTADKKGRTIPYVMNTIKEAQDERNDGGQDPEEVKVAMLSMDKSGYVQIKDIDTGLEILSFQVQSHY